MASVDQHNFNMREKFTQSLTAVFRVTK